MFYLFAGGTGGLFLDAGSSNSGPSFLPLPVQLLEQIMTGATEPGVTTLRMPQDNTQQRDPQARDVDIEVCFVCKKCRVAFSSESNLLTHQRQCFGGNLDNRGAYRIVQAGFECKLCPNDKFRSTQEFKKHAESDSHSAKLLLAGKIAGAGNGGGMVPPPPSESPLSHEMEDVVNQITLLAARAAQEASSDGARVPTSVDSNSNSTFCQPSEPKRRFLAPGDVAQPLTSAGH